MHWTALLARRSFPDDARVADDLPCFRCGYNLRGLLARTTCPECNEPIADSLYLLRRPEIVASSFNVIALSHLSVAALLTLFLGAGGVALCVLALAIAAAVRLVASIELRVRGGLEGLPLVGMHAQRMLVLHAVECALGLASLLGLLFAGPTTTGTALQLLGLAAAIWPVAVIVAALQAGRTGGMLAQMIDYDFIHTELVIHRILALSAVAIALLFAIPAVLIGGAGGASLVAAGGIVALLVYAVATGVLVVGLMHLANAAQRTTEPRDDVLRVEHPPQPARGARRGSRPAGAAAALPDIELAPADAAAAPTAPNDDRAQRGTAS